MTDCEHLGGEAYVADATDDIGPWMDLRGRLIRSTDEGQDRRTRSLVGSDLRGARIRQLGSVDLSLATLAGADLRGAFTEWIFGASANFRGADFTGATLWQSRFYRCDFTGAILSGTRMAGVVAVACEFTGARFDGTTFGGADPTGASAEPFFFCERFGIRGEAKPWSTSTDDNFDELGFLDSCIFTGSIGLPPEAMEGAERR